MWLAYAKSEEAARELVRDMLSRRVGPIVWVAWEMSATWVEPKDLDVSTCAASRPGA